MDDLKAGKIDVVVVYKVDRLSRSLLDFAKIMDRFNQAGVAFVSITQNFSTADAMGRLTLNMLMSFAEFEREMIAERTRDKIAAARRKGKWTGGMVPLGYDVKDRRLMVNKLEAVIVEETFDLYMKIGSALEVAKALDKRGWSTKRHRAASGHVRMARPWDKHAVLRILRNPIYAGYMPYGEELHNAEHVPIIDKKKYACAQALLDSHGGSRKKRGRNNEYLLSGLLCCTGCKGMFTPASTRNKGRIYRYYRCVTKDKRGREACLSRPLPADAVESFVVQRIREAVADGRLAKDVTDRLHARIEKERKPLKLERRELPKLIAKVSADGRRLVESLSQAKDGGRKLLEERIEEVGMELGRLETRLAEVERELAVIDNTKIEMQWICKALQDFDAIWDSLTLENRRRLIQTLVKGVLVNEPEGNITVTLAELWGTEAGL